MYAKHILALVDQQHINPRTLLKHFQKVDEAPRPDLADNKSFNISVPHPNNFEIHIGNQTPGPGSYISHSQYVKRTVKRASQTQPLKVQRITHPGPGEYHNSQIPQRIDRKNRTQPISMGKSKRRPLQEGSFLQNPPPGQYEIKSKMVETQGTKLYPNLYEKKVKQNTPGPGQHEPKLIPKEKSPECRIGTSQRYDFTKEGRGLPAPGAYDPQIKKFSPSFGFGTSQRPPLAHKNNNPGPGAHEIQPAIGIIPEYIKNHKISR